MSTASDQVTTWLAGFGAALDRCDLEAVGALFGEEAHGRDLVAFTWNIKTMEGRAAILEMLESRAIDTAASDWQLDGEPTEAGGIIEAWLTFETAVGRGIGHLRLRDGGAWTLFTTLQELKGFEEQQGLTREFGVELGAIKNRATWLQRRQQEEAELGYVTQDRKSVV